jgi:sugar lactone lactonase YvrE
MTQKLRCSLTSLAPVLVASALTAAAASARAHGDDEDGVDVGLVRTHLSSARDAAPDAATGRAYRGMLRATSGHDRAGIADDLARLSGVQRLTARLPAPDSTLDALLGDLLAAADARLAVTEPDALADMIQRMRKAADRARVTAAGERAAQALADARTAAQDGDRARTLRLLRLCATRYAKAVSLADAVIRRQNGGLPQFKSPAPRSVYTVAGIGSGGFNGDGRAARRSSLYFVDDVTIGPDGLLYILDWNNHRVRVRRADGTIGEVCGSGNPGDSEGAAAATELNHPSQVAFGPDGRMFIAAWHNHKVKVLDASGTSPVVSTIAGGTQGASQTDGLAATDARFNLVPGILLLPEGHPLGSGDLLLTDATNARVMCVRLGTHPVQGTNVAGVTVTTGTCERIFGTGTPGYSGDGGPANAAQFEFSKSQNAQPDGRMAIDAQGNVYVVMGVRHVVRRVAPDGTVTTFAGNGTAGHSGDGGPATSARLNFPADVAVGPDGSVFISDSLNHVIRRVAPDGTISTWAGTPGATGYAGDDGAAGGAVFDHPSGIEVDADGNVYVCDRGNSVIRVVTSDAPGDVPLPVDPVVIEQPSRGGAPKDGVAGTISTYAGSGVLGFNGEGRPALDTDLYWPQDVGVDPATGLVHFLDWNNHRVRRVEDDGSVRTVVGSGELGDDTGDGSSVPLNHPTDLAFDPVNGELWIAGWHTDKVLRLDGNTHEITYTAGGKRGFAGDGGPANLAQLNLCSSVKFDAQGNWYVADEANRRIRRVDRATNVITTIAGTGFATDALHPLGDGGPATQATLNLPVGQSAQPGGRIALSPDDAFLYVADTDNHRIRRIDLAANVITTVAGTGDPTGPTRPRGDGGPATSATLSSPVDVDCDAAGNVYVADRDNHAIRRIDLSSGTITTVAGGNGPGYTGDGSAATGARMNRPCGIFVERSSGRVYVADTYNGVIRVIWE